MVFPLFIIVHDNTNACMYMIKHVYSHRRVTELAVTIETNMISIMQIHMYTRRPFWRCSRTCGDR